ncbi:ABC transporter ATP-binding protein, partial [Micromonospora aurantiaca]|nr:ABC transporter ATP-binding protein [Micromonospora aurantiaca]
AWHHRHPTGQLLSNANADVEAVWAPIAPLPMAVGVVFMLLIAAVSMLVTDVVVAAVAFLVFPAVALINVVYQRRLSPVATRAQQL